MKNIFKFLIVLIGAGALFVSCEKVPYFEANSHAINPNDTYYVQFKNAQLALRTGVKDGNLINIDTTVAVALLGGPQSVDIVVPLTVNAATTADANTYQLSAMSVTIPAGKTSGTVDFTGFAEMLEQNKTVKVVLDMDGGEHAATAGQQLTYTMFRICALSPENIVGDWTINMVDIWGDGWNGGSITVIIDGVGTDYTLEDGGSGSYTINVPAGSQSLSFVFNSGDYDEEITFVILGPNGAVVGSDGPTPFVGEIVLDACVL